MGWEIPNPNHPDDTWIPVCHHSASLPQGVSGQDPPVHRGHPVKETGKTLMPLTSGALRCSSL